MAISLQKGQRVSLEKSDGSSLKKVCVGVNWGMIEKKKLWWKEKIAVDLDASAAIFNANKELIDIVYFGKLISDCKAIIHSGDDLTGDEDGDDGLDNEVIEVDLSLITRNANQVVFLLNSYKGQDFKDIPFASIRIYEGTPERVVNLFATYDVANDIKFAGSVSMILGKLYTHQNNWKFHAIGDPTSDRDLKQTIIMVGDKYI